MILPRNGMLLVKLVEQDLVTEGGIVLPSPEPTESIVGIVEAIDPITGEYTPGDRVVFHRSAVREAIVDGKRIYFIHSNQVMAIAMSDNMEVN